MFAKRSLFVLSLSAVLAACGGGGGGDDQSSAPSGPLAKYIGSYSYCDQDHTKYSVSLTDAGNEKLNALFSEVTYQNSNCSGTILGDYKWNSPGTVSLISTGISTVSVQGLPSSLSIDKVSMTVNTQATLTGLGVSGNCVTYPNGEICYDLTVQGQSSDAALYISGNTLYELYLDNGVYYEEGTYSRN